MASYPASWLIYGCFFGLLVSVSFAIAVMLHSRDRFSETSASYSELVNVHWVSVALAGLIFLYQLIPSTRSRYPQIHRLLGYVSTTLVMISFILGTIAYSQFLHWAYREYGSPIANWVIVEATLSALVGFTFLIVGIQGICYARKHNFDAHRRCMLRLVASVLVMWIVYRFIWVVILLAGGINPVIGLGRGFQSDYEKRIVRIASISGNAASALYLVFQEVYIFRCEKNPSMQIQKPVDMDITEMQ